MDAISFFRSPVFEDDEVKTRSAKILNHVQCGMMILLSLSLLIAVPFVYERKSAGTVFALAMAAVIFISRSLMNRGYVRHASAFLIYALWILFETLIVTGSGLKDMYFAFLISLSVAAGLLLGRRATLSTSAMTVGAGLLLLFMEELGYLPLNYFPNPPLARWIQLAFSLFLLSTTLNLALRSLEDSLGFARTQLEERRKAEDALRQEITERKRSENALKESAAQYRALIETTDTGYVIIDIEGRVLDANKEYLRLAGHSSLKDILGRSVIEWTADYEKSKNMEAVKKCLKEGYVRNLEIDYVDSRGNVTPIEVNATVVEKDGMTRILSLCRDITKRRLAERERQQLQERLRRAGKMEALGLLAGGVAHDLNNVLGVLVGYSELLLMETPKDSPLRVHASTILQGGQRAAKVIQDLLTLARRGVAVPETVNLNRIVSDVLESPEFQKLKSYHPAMTLKTELEPRLLNTKGSPVHLGKMVMNLVSNAAEAISGFGEVTIRTENRVVDKPVSGYENTQEGEYVVLTVSDTGAGIHPEDLGRIFEPFYTKKVMGRSGTGLGLAVVWGTVKDHDGYIDVQSEEGKGSKFILYFRMTREEMRPENEPVAREKYLGRGEHILVVDDVEGQRLLASSMLSKLGYQVEVVAGGEEAVEYVKKHPVDLLVLDMIMEPGMDGLDCYRRIKEICPEQKAVIVSGFSETDRVRQARELGAGAYVRKPYLIESLGLAVRQELDRS